MILAIKIASVHNKPPETPSRLLGSSMGSLVGQKRFSFFLLPWISLSCYNLLSQVPVWDQISQFHIHLPWITLVYCPSTDAWFFRAISFLQNFQPQKLRISRHYHACNMICPSNPTWFHHKNYIRWGAKVTKLLTMQTFFFFLPTYIHTYSSAPRFGTTSVYVLPLKSEIKFLTFKNSTFSSRIIFVWDKKFSKCTSNFFVSKHFQVDISNGYVELMR